MAKKENKNNEKNNDSKKKKLESIDKIIFAGFTLIIIVFVFIALFAMNVFNMKTKVVDKISQQLIENEKNAAETFVGEEMTRQYEEKIAQGFLRIKKRNEELVNWEENLTKKESEVSNEEEEIGQKTQEIEKLLTEINGEYQDINELSKVVENMEAENAANMLAEIEDLQLVRNVIFNIDEEYGALILENLEPSLAAQIVLQRYNNKEELEEILEESSQEEISQEGGEVVSGSSSDE